jgi:hypothetical protein
MFIKIRAVFIPYTSKFYLIQDMITLLLIFLYFFIGLSLRCKVSLLFELVGYFGLPHKAIKPAKLGHLFVLFLFIKTIVSKILISVLLGKDLRLVRDHFFDSQLSLRFTNLILIFN